MLNKFSNIVYIIVAHYNLLFNSIYVPNNTTVFMEFEGFKNKIPTDMSNNV